ncbi:hypothetical protein FS842_001035 [Serendipita sp. 407]|nr:hypothetical protein FS842_001035 [Serendipita sp. 407]
MGGEKSAARRMLEVDWKTSERPIRQFVRVRHKPGGACYAKTSTPLFSRGRNSYNNDGEVFPSIPPPTSRPELSTNHTNSNTSPRIDREQKVEPVPRKQGKGYNTPRV